MSLKRNGRGQLRHGQVTADEGIMVIMGIITIGIGTITIAGAMPKKCGVALGGKTC